MSALPSDALGQLELLCAITGPEDVQALPAEALPALAQEIRDLILDVVPRTGGHLGPNLGVVELTIALHRVFHSPYDRIVWDTGHQAYVHKLLTGRAAEFCRLRQAGGLSGYPSRRESEHDLVENSHASTALGYADGLAKAAALRGEHDRAVVAVVGDGALTGGMAWEALNNLGAAPERPVIVVLNDNGRSYAPTAGGLSRHLAELAACGSAAPVFEQIGLAYVGPVDGHDVAAVERALHDAIAIGRPVVVHCLTVKGRGYEPACHDEADRMHSVTPKRTGLPSRPAWTDVFREELVRLARTRPDLVAISAAMVQPAGLDRLAREMPGRVFDVGIAEQHALVSAAGLAMGGMHPVVAVYATFLNRAFDQTLLDVALHGLPVTLVLDRAGITGNDGASHHGMWDLSLLGLVPGMRVAAPRDGVRLRALLAQALEIDRPTALRFPKGSTPADLPPVGSLGGADLLVDAPRADVLLLPVGPLAGAAVAAAADLEYAGVPVRVADPGWVLPVDPTLAEAAARHRLVVTVEDGGRAGGFGDAVRRALADLGAATDVRSLAVPQAFLPHGERDAQLAELGLDREGIAAAVLDAVGTLPGPSRSGRRRTSRLAAAR